MHWSLQGLLMRIQSISGVISANLCSTGRLCGYMNMRVSALALIAAIWAVAAINTNLAQKATVSTVQFSQTVYTCEEHSDDEDSSFDLEEQLQAALSSTNDRNCFIQLSRSDTASEVTVMVTVLPNRGSATFDPEIARGNSPLYKAHRDINLLGQRFGDFNPTPQRVTFGPGVSEMSVNFTIYNDACPESDEDFYVQLESMDGSETSDPPCRVVIQENDQDLLQNGAEYSQSDQRVTLQIPVDNICEDRNFSFQLIYEGFDSNPNRRYPKCSPIYVEVKVSTGVGEQNLTVFKSLLPAHQFGLDEAFPSDPVSVPAVMDGLFENDNDESLWKIIAVPIDVYTTTVQTWTGDIDDIVVRITPESQEVDNPQDQVQFSVELVNMTSQLEPGLLVDVTLGVQCMDGLPDDCVTLSPTELTFDQTSESSFRHHVTATPKDSLVLDSDKRFIVHVMDVTVNGKTESADHTETSVTFRSPRNRGCRSSVLFNSATVTIKKFLLCVGWSVNSSSLTVLENEGPARLTLQLQSEDGSQLEFQPYNVTLMVTTLEITGASDAAEAPEDYTSQQFEVTIPVGELSVEVVIPITDDIFPEGLERFQVMFNVIDEQDEFIRMCGANTTTVTIVDNDPHCVDWSPDSLDLTLVESEGPARLTIRLSITDGTQPEPLNFVLALQINYIPITAEAPEDYTPQQFAVTIPAGELSVEVVIPIVNDVVPEGPERFQVMFNFTVEEDQLIEICTGNTATVNIDDDDDPRCIVWSSDSLNQTLAESEGPATLTLQLQSTDGTQPEPLDYPLDLQIRYIPITAEAPEDYTPQQFAVTIPAGELSVEVVIPIVDDIVPEGPERFLVMFNFTEEQDGTVQMCSGNTATVNIDDDDDPRCIVWSSDSLDQTLAESEGPATLTLQLQSTDGTQPEPLDYPLDLQIRYIPITAEAPEDYTPQQFEVTIPAGELSVEVVIPIVDDIVPEGRERFLVRFNFTDEQDDTVQICTGNTATVNIDDDDDPRCIVWSSDSLDQTLAESEGPATLTLQLQSTDGTQPEPLDYPLDLQIRYIPITAEAPEDYTPQQFEVTIPAGELSVEVVIPIVDDIVPEGRERFLVRFNFTDEQDDTVQICSGNTATVNIDDDDDPRCIVWSSDSLDQTLAESEGPATLTLQLQSTDGTQPEPLDYPLDLQIRYIPITAEAPEDYTPQQFEVTIPAGELSVEVVIPIVDDIVPEGRERFQVMFNFIDEQGDTVQICSGNTATVNIDDDDDPRCIVWSSDSLDQTLAESEGPVTLTLQLQSTDGTQPEPLDYPLDLQIRYIPITAEAPEDYTPQQFEVTIPAGELSVEVVIPIVDDNIPEGPERFQVMFNFIDEQGDTVQICSGNTATVNIDDDDDLRCIVWSSDSLDQTLAESEGPATLTLQLQSTDGTQPEPLDYPLDLQIRYTPITAEAPEDYTPQQLAVTIPAGELSVEVVIPIVDDIVPEGRENFQVIFNLADEDDELVVICGTSTATVNIDDDDNVCVVWQRTTPLIVMEDAGTATLEMRLEDRVGNAIQLPYPVVLEITTTGDSATAPSDFDGRSQEVTIVEGEQRVMVDIPIVNDALLEEEEVFSVTVAIIRVPDDVRERINVCGNSSVIVRIPDDDNVALQLGSTDCVDEGDEATLTITKNGEHQERIVIVVTTIDDTATAGDDFQLLTNVVTFTPEQQQNSIRIKILEDSKFDPNDKFTVKIEVLNTDPRRPRITITEDTVDVTIACKGERQEVRCGVTVDPLTCTTATAALQCDHNATGNVTFIWRREGLLLNGEVSQTLQTSNVGEYTCGVVLPDGNRVGCRPATLGEPTLERSFTGPGGSDSCTNFLGNIPTSICSIPDICVAAGDTLTLDCLTVPLSDSTITTPNGDIIPTGRFGPAIADSSVQGTYTCTTPDYVCPEQSERCVFVYEPATCSEIQPSDLPTETNNVRIASVTPQGVNVRALGDINEVQLYCRFDGIPEPTITWLDPDRQQLSSGAKFSITQSGDISILTIRNYNNDSDIGEYSCSIENGGGRQTCSATLGVCGRCIAGEWSECLPNCIRGKRYRNVTCEGGDECLNLPRCQRCTHLNRKCDKYPMWKSWPWTACSTTCDSGYKIRKVMCFVDSENIMVDDSLCEGPCSAKPSDYQECNGAKTCCTEDTSSPTYCGLVKRGGLCSNDNYKYKCCKTCDYPFGPPGN